MKRRLLPRKKRCCGCTALLTWPRGASRRKWMALVRCPSCERESILDRLLSDVRVTKGGCWEKRGADGNGLGYKIIMVHDKRRYVHVLSFKLHGGTLRRGQEVCHTCDNPPCINPKHLFAGSHRANIHDMHRKGRAAPMPRFYGAVHPIAKGPATKVRRALALLATGEQQRTVAKLLGVSQTTIWSWLHGRTRSCDSGIRRPS